MQLFFFIYMFHRLEGGGGRLKGSYDLFPLSFIIEKKKQNSLFLLGFHDPKIKIMSQVQYNN